MITKNKQKLPQLLVLLLVFTSSIKAQNYPASDPSNSGGWILNEGVSDEFNGTELDKDKWWILGENGDYRSKWKGRAPGQFVPHNIKVENGDLTLTSDWEPNYTFANEIHSGTYYGGSTSAPDNSKPITQACIMSETYFKYGYMEIRCKVADAPVTSGFWTTGYHSEIDMIENFGKIANGSNTSTVLEKKYRTNLISWDPEPAANYEEWKVEDILNVRVASDYFVYGFEWDENYMKTYFNGQLIRHVTKQELEVKDQWRYDYPQELWLSSEVFSWYGLPSASDFATPGEYKVDYIRIWQKEITGPDFNALGFEGPFHFQGKSVPWWSPGTTSWKMKDDNAANGDFSLRYKHTGTALSETIFSPYGSLELPSGNNEMSFNIWIDPSTTVNRLDFTLESPWTTFSVDLTGVEKGKWVEVSQSFNRTTESGGNDRIRIITSAVNIISASSLFYIDDIQFKNVLSVKETSPVSFAVYPNPARDLLTISSKENGLIHIYNQLGALVKTAEKTKVTEEIMVSNLVAGIYIVTISSNNRITTKKIVIE